jgi:transitional endoplasmic reticulum ATPase
VTVTGGDDPAAVQPLTMRATLHAAPFDARRGIVRVHPQVLSLLGLRPWEPLVLTGKRRTGALVAPALPDVAQDALLMDELVLGNVGVHPGEQVQVAPASVVPAESITLGGLPDLTGDVDADTLRLALLGKVVTAGDGVSLLPQDFVRPDDADSSRLVRTLAERWGESWQSWVLTVTATEPRGLVRVGMQTAVTAGTTATATSSTRLAARATIADLPALDTQVKVLREWLRLGFHQADLLSQLGASPEVGVLVSGPPGSGKGPLVEAVAYDVGATLFRLWAPALARGEAASAAKVLKETLAKAAARSPAVVLIEDVEAIAPRADAGPLLSVLLESVADAVRGGQVAVVCTTSKPEEVCPDLRRPGRLDHELAIPLPQRAQRQRILATFTRSVPLAPDVRLDELAAKTPGFVAADLQALCREASLRAAQRVAEATTEAATETPVVTSADFVAALEVVRPSAVEQSTLEVADVSMDDVGGLAEVKRNLTEMVVWPLTYPETFARLGVEPGRGVLLYGPPGCGKTYLVKALANEAQANFFAVRGAELLSKWVGESERGVRELFRRARGSAPALVFFDEVDALAPERGAQDNGPTDRVVAQLLTELDGIEELREVFVVAATNRPELVDAALLRPGRLDRLVHVPPPDAVGRADILRAVTKRMPLAADVDLDAIGAACERYSAADLEALAREAAMNAMRESMAAPVVTAAHFAAARATVRPSIDPDVARRTQEWAERLR